jgi:beta-glucanase (GH16 family)
MSFLLLVAHQTKPGHYPGIFQVFTRLIALFLCVLSLGWVQTVYGESVSPIDSTKHGFHAAKISMYFKKNWDIRSAYYSYRFRHLPKNSSTLILPEEAKEYGLVFEDNFDSLNTEVWSKGQPWGRFHPDNAHQFYGDPQVFVADGKLHLLNEPKPYPIIIENQPKGDIDRIFKAMRETNLIQENLVQIQRVNEEGQVIDQNSVNYQIQQHVAQVDTGKLAVMIPYSIGIVNTYHSMNFTHGFFAIRSKNPDGPATWPAWWLTGRNNWPPEIDIFEMYGKATGNAVNTQTMTVHTGKVETHTKQMMMKKLRVSEDTDSLFHIYACLWTPKKINFYTDGVIVKSIRLNRWMAQFYQEPMFLVLNNALENTYIPDLIKSGNKTSDFQVDWVQVYQLYAEETHE